MTANPSTQEIPTVPKPSKSKLSALIAAGAAFLLPAAGVAVTASTAAADPTPPNPPLPYVSNPAGAAIGTNAKFGQFAVCATQAVSDGYTYTSGSYGPISGSAVYSPSTDCWYVTGSTIEGVGATLTVNAKAGTMSGQVSSVAQPNGSSEAKTQWIANHAGTVSNNAGFMEVTSYTVPAGSTAWVPKHTLSFYL